MAGSTGKSGVSLSSKHVGGKSLSFGPTGTKLPTFGPTGSKSSNVGFTAPKKINFEFEPRTNTTSGSTPSKTITFGAPFPARSSSSARSPSFIGTSAKVSSGLTPSTSRKTYEAVSYSPKIVKTYETPSNNPKNEKSSTSFGIIWLPGRKRNKKKDLIYSSIKYDQKNERTPAMYNVMSGDSPDYQLHKKKDEEASLLVPEKVKGPIATAASTGPIVIVTEAPSDLAGADTEEKLLNRDKEDNKEAAGDSNKEETDFLENNDVVNKIPGNKQDKSSDKVDSIYMNPSGIKPPPPQSTTSNPDEDDCIIKCLYYTLQCCDCVIM